MEISSGLSLDNWYFCPFCKKVCGDAEHTCGFVKDLSTHVEFEDLGKRIKNKRFSEELTLRDVAEKTGISASTLSRIENGRLFLSTDTLIALAEWLDVPIMIRGDDH